MNFPPTRALGNNITALGNVPFRGDTKPLVREIRLLTLNLGLPCFQLAGGWRVALAENHPDRLSAAPDILASADADVIALQEVYSSADRNVLVGAMAAQYRFCAQVSRSRSLLGSGLMVLSRFPIVRSEFIPCHGGPWWLGPLWLQGFLLAEIDLPLLGTISLINVHLAASLPFDDVNAPASEQNRRREVSQLLAVAEKVPDAVILLGDFNCDDVTCPANYRRILAAGYSDAFVVANGSAHSGAFTWDAANPVNSRGRFRDFPSQRIDHVFVRTDYRGALEPVAARIVFQDKLVRTKSAECVCVSDHYGMMVTLAVSGTSRFISGQRQHMTSTKRPL